MSTSTASLSLDLDNAWSYLKTRGDEAWRDYPSYLDLVVPIALDLFAELDQPITFFVVGIDAEREPATIARLAEAGHEVGNHSHRHEPWLHRYGDEELEDELDRAEAAITAATGSRPTGFRGPGYSLTPSLLRSLAARGYDYDASTLPTWIGPLARAYYFRTAKLDKQQRKQREALFGSFADVRWPVSSYRFSLANRDLVEIPVTTFPWVRVPMHLSYVLYLEGVSSSLARRYFRLAVAACRRAGVEPSLLMHPLDLIGADDTDEGGLAFFPAMGLPGARKRALVRDCLAVLRRDHDVVPLRDHAAKLAAQDLPIRSPEVRPGRTG